MNTFDEQLTTRQSNEELANSLSHGLGMLLASAACALLPVFAVLYGSARHVVGFSLFGASAVILYISSTLYHTAKGKRVKSILQIVDHTSIYILIAGTYTPFAISAMNNSAGWVLFGISWGLALIGILFKSFFGTRYNLVSTGFYLLMGWLVMFFMKPLLASISDTSLLYLILGGIAYTVGIIFYLFEKIPFGHAIWHLFVLAGTILHIFSVLYILPL